MLENFNDSVPRLQERLNGRKILHFGSLAGWPHTCARVSRELGIPAENWVHIYKDTDEPGLDRQLPYDASIFEAQDPYFKKIVKTIKFLKDCPTNFGLVHYHSTTLLHREYHFLFEGPYLKRKNIPMVLSLGGGDARLLKMANDLNQYFYKPPNYLHDLKMKLRWLSWRKNISVCATDPEMALIAEQYFEKVALFKQPVQLDRFPCNIPSEDNHKPLLLHVPTSPHVKGTENILKAVERLKQKGLQFEFEMKRQLHQVDFYNVLSKADIYIDELRCGAHGVTAVESMAMGKPTISYIREDLIHRYPNDLPLVNANPDTIEDVLERLILDAKLRQEIGTASRLYVEKYHDANKVISELATTYLEILN